MASTDTDLINHLYSAHTIQSGVKCLIEYNMNSMIKDITVESSGEYVSNGSKPYRKLFPAESVIAPFRPVMSGVKYYIYTASGDASSSAGEPGLFQRSKAVLPSSALPRLYFAGAKNYYKYWASAINTDASMTIKYPKFVLANKILVRFEKYHEIPSACTITLKYSDGTNSGPISATPNSNGESIIYYGTSWSTTESSLVTSNDKKITEVTVNATNRDQDRVTAIIEISPRLVRDLSSDVVNFTINKESSNSAGDGVLPVGSVTANTLSIDLAKYDNESMQYLSYDDTVSSPDHLKSDKNYLIKNAEIKMYMTVDVSGTIKTINQGTYFINQYSIGSYGDVHIEALDGAKYLQETLMPNLYLESYPVTAILSAVLDNVGMTNYNFNTASTEAKVDESINIIKYFSTDDTMTVWDTIQQICMDTQMNAVFDDNNILQFYTRNYMYNNSRNINFSFYSEPKTVAGVNRIANIISFSKREIPATNQVIVRWQVPQIVNQGQSAEPVWQSPVTILGGGGLRFNLPYPQTKQTMPDQIGYYVLFLEPNVTSSYEAENAQALYQYAGYLLIDSEIIEYDAIGFEYNKGDGLGAKFFWATSQTDVDKYRAMVPSYAGDTTFFKPAGVYRIKENADGTIAGRGALGTTPASHVVGQATAWTDYTGVEIK